MDVCIHLSMLYYPGKQRGFLRRMCRLFLIPIILKISKLNVGCCIPHGVFEVLGSPSPPPPQGPRGEGPQDPKVVKL